MIVAQGVYLAIGVGYQATFKRGGGGVLVPNAAFWMNIAGLVRDGIAFTLAGGRKPVAGPPSKAAGAVAGREALLGGGAARGESAAEAASGPAHAQRGDPTPLHFACTIGDLARVKAALKDKPAGLDFDAGDRRQFTAYHQVRRRRRRRRWKSLCRMPC